MKYRRFLKVISIAENSVYLLLLFAFIMYRIFEYSFFYYTIIFSYVCLPVIFWTDKTFPYKDRWREYDWFIEVTIGNMYMTYFFLYWDYFEIFCKMINPTTHIKLGAVITTVTCLCSVFVLKKFTNYIFRSGSGVKKDVIPFKYRQRLKRLTKRVIIMLFFMVFAMYFDKLI